MSSWVGPTGWATDWATGLAYRILMGIKLAHGLTHWASKLPMGLNNNWLGRPLARWAVGFLGQVVGRGLFDDPYSMVDYLIALGQPSSEAFKLNLYCNSEHLIYKMDDLLVLDDAMDELEIF